MNIETIEKLRRCFESMAVYKDLKKNNVFSTLGLPSFMRDWLLQKFENDDGSFDTDTLKDFVKTYIPKHDDWTEIKNRLVINYEQVKILAKILVDINIVTGEVSFSMPDFGLGNKDTMIESDVWERCKDELVSGHETWGMIELGYRMPDESARPKIPGKIKLLSFRNFCRYEINTDYYRDIRGEFSTSEWIDVILCAVDYNADGYETAKMKNESLPEVDTMKMAMLSRILPFVEKRLNMIELAPMGTGKSYLFGQVSRYGWLSTSDKMSRAKLFYDISKREEGLMAQNDFVVLD
jgi:ATP-dependent Lon protease